MKLYVSETSPFVRKVLTAAEEAGLAGRFERVEMNSFDPRGMRRMPNPIAKVPCLETDDGLALYDSPVIVEYLDSLLDRPVLIPPSGRDRWDALRRQALADGMMDALVLAMVEGLRKPERQSRGWIAHQQAVVTRSLAALEAEADALDGPADIGRIAIAVAVEFMADSAPDQSWRADHPRLAAWADAFGRRPSMQATRITKAADFLARQSA